MEGPQEDTRTKSNINGTEESRDQKVMSSNGADAHSEGNPARSVKDNENVPMSSGVTAKSDSMSNVDSSALESTQPNPRPHEVVTKSDLTSNVDSSTLEAAQPAPRPKTPNLLKKSYTVDVYDDPVDVTRPGDPRSVTVRMATPRVKHLHKLEKKHSSGDLQSRLKTRKLLGVGKTDDGDVHRSKLSQILGHSEQLFVKLPKGLCEWIIFTAIVFTATALWALVFPRQIFDFTFDSDEGKNSVLPIRLYGAVLLSFSLILWSAVYSLNKELIKWILVSSTLYLILQSIVVTLHTWQGGKGYSLDWNSLVVARCILVIVNAYFYLILVDGLHVLARHFHSDGDDTNRHSNLVQQVSSAEAQNMPCPSFFPEKKISDKKTE